MSPARSTISVPSARRPLMPSTRWSTQPSLRRSKSTVVDDRTSTTKDARSLRPTVMGARPETRRSSTMRPSRSTPMRRQRVWAGAVAARMTAVIRPGRDSARTAKGVMAGQTARARRGSRSRVARSGLTTTVHAEVVGRARLAAPAAVGGSVSTSTQAPPQRFVSGPHTHCPPWQIAPAAHRWPHVPQLVGSLVVSVQSDAAERLAAVARAHAAGAALVARAGVAAGPAVAGVVQRVHAVAVARHEARPADARTATAGLAGAASLTAASAVLGIAARVGASPVAVRLAPPEAARPCRRRGCAHVAGAAGVAAGPAVVRVDA